MNRFGIGEERPHHAQPQPLPGRQPIPTLLRLPEVLRITGLSDSALWRQTVAGTFPRPVKLSERSSAWVEAEVRAWVANRIAERDAGGATHSTARGAGGGKATARAAGPNAPSAPPSEQGAA